VKVRRSDRIRIRSGEKQFSVLSKKLGDGPLFGGPLFRGSTMPGIAMSLHNCGIGRAWNYGRWVRVYPPLGSVRVQDTRREGRLGSG
jgi:hypothetical protein